jgi:hypothetical protein
MMASAMMTLLVASAVAFGGPTNEEGAGTAAERIARQVVDKGYKKVGVLPRFIARKPGGDESLGGPIGPQSEKFAEDLEDALSTASDGKFLVVPGRQLKKAFEGLKLDDLADPSTLSKVSERADGLDALVIGNVVDGRDLEADGRVGGLDVRCQVIDLKSGGLAGAAREKVSPSLSDGAYMGESWELRRWTDAGLTNVGFDETGDGGGSVSPFGAGPVYEERQYAMVRRDRPHPLLDPAFPYPVEIVVGSEVRAPVQVDGKLYVALEPGEVYAIRVKNLGPRPIYSAVFVDGINILGKTRETPASCRYWSLKAGEPATFRGWYTGMEGSFKEEEFMVAPADDTVAVGQGFDQNLGLITVVDYTVGMADVPEAPTLKAMVTGGTFGTGTSGKTRELKLEQRAGDRPGVILAAVTIHYATSSQIKQLQAGKTRD